VSCSLHFAWLYRNTARCVERAYLPWKCDSFLCALAYLRNEPLFFVMPVCPHISARLPLDEFREILYLVRLWKSVEEINLVKIGQKYRPLYIEDLSAFYRHKSIVGMWPINSKWTHCCFTMTTFSILITLLALRILYIKIHFIPHREHRCFLWGANWI
jgi:hypothetical protein